VIVALKAPIPADGIYRKFKDGAWADYVVDTGNLIASALGSEGACPAVGSSQYITGLTVGDNCVQLTIVDGGPNDADGVANGMIKDPGGIAVPLNIVLEVLDLNESRITEVESNAVLLWFTLESVSGDVMLNDLTLQAGGNAKELYVRQVNLVVDSNANGVVDVDEGEVSIASGVYSANDGSLVLAMDELYEIKYGTTHFLVTYDFVGDL